MKNQFAIYVLFICFFLVILTSCSLKDNICKNGQGDIITLPRTVATFTALEARANVTINLFQHASIKQQVVTISAQENIIDLIQTRIAGQSLIIDATECYDTNEEVIITIQTPALSQIILAGTGNILLQDTVRQTDLELILEGSGNIKNTSNSPIIVSNSCNARIKGSGNMELDFDSTTLVNAALDGSGTIILRGEAKENKLNMSGSGIIKAFNLPVLTSTAELIGAGIIELTATDPDSTINTSKATVNAQISGSGTLRVKGNASIKWNIAGSGKIERIE